MRVLLINPPITLSDREHISYSMPLGLAYLASVAKEEGHQVDCLDALIEGYEHSPLYVDTESGGFFHYGLSLEDIARIIEKRRPDVLGISCPFTLTWGNVVAISKIAKSIDTGIKVVIGGAHPSALPRDSLLDTVDFIVIGEGETTFVEWLRCLQQGAEVANLRRINGIAFKQSGRVFLTPPREPIKDLDKLPFPAWELLPMDKYDKAAKSGKAHGTIKGSRYMNVVTSRGCPFRCIFCSIHSVWGRGWRVRSPENVVAEIEELVTKYQVSEIHFEDDNLTLDKKRMARICDLIIDRGLSISWVTPNGVSINALDSELLTKMKKSGCYHLCFGIESGNEYIRNKIIKKPINYEHAKSVIKTCKELGIWTHGFFVIGLPGESIQMMYDSLEAAKELNLDNADFYIAAPYPGTRLYDVALAHGYLNGQPEFTNFRVTIPLIGTEEFTPEDVAKLQRQFYKSFVRYRLKKEVSPLSIINRVSHLRSWGDIQFLLRKALALPRYV